jgi:hypothetical protein
MHGDHDSIGGFSQGGVKLRAEAADGEAGAGKRMAVEELRGQLELAAYLADLVLVQRL